MFTCIVKYVLNGVYWHGHITGLLSLSQHTSNWGKSIYSVGTTNVQLHYDMWWYAPFQLVSIRLFVDLLYHGPKQLTNSLSGGKLVACQVNWTALEPCILCIRCTLFLHNFFKIKNEMHSIPCGYSLLWPASSYVYRPLLILIESPEWKLWSMNRASKPVLVQCTSSVTSERVVGGSVCQSGFEIFISIFLCIFSNVLVRLTKLFFLLSLFLVNVMTVPWFVRLGVGLRVNLWTWSPVKILHPEKQQEFYYFMQSQNYSSLMEFKDCAGNYMQTSIPAYFYLFRHEKIRFSVHGCVLFVCVWPCDGLATCPGCTLPYAQWQLR